MTEKHKILIVDDAKVSVQMLKTYFGNKYDLRTAYSGDEALLILEEFPADLVLMDIIMPGIDGYETCKLIRNNPKHELTRIILISGQGMIEDKLKGYKAGADDFITKPFVPEELLAKVKVYLRLLSAEQNLRDLNTSLEEKVLLRTEQLRQQGEALISSAKLAAIGEMAAGVAHEINTPLSIIVSRVGLLLKGIDSDVLDIEKIKTGLTQIKSTANMVTKIMMGLKTVSRNSETDPMEKVNVSAIVEDAIVLCRDRFRKASVDLNVDAEPNTELWIEGRATQLTQVLINLLGNAFDAISSLPEKWVNIKVSRSIHGIVISITDSGYGIPDQVLAKMMDAFFTTKAVGQGTGLGLSISKNIIENHQGKLYYDRNSPRTCFVIKLPLTQASVELPYEKKSAG